MTKTFALRHVAAAAAITCTVAVPAFAQSTDAAAGDAQRITITTGRGQMRSVQGLTQSDFDAVPAGTSPLATVSRLPGVNFQAADPLGNYEWSTRFTVRSFSQNQLGFTLDDVPLGDMSYGNFNGLHISRAIASENVSRALLSQGTGSLETASSSNLGGTLQFYSSDPREQFGLQANQTFGSNSDRRSFLRVDSGETAVGRFYASVADQNTDKWKGSGEQKNRQFNLKGVKTWGDTRVAGFVNTSRRREIDYQDMSLGMIDRLGYSWDNFYPNFSAAVNASNTLCGNNGSTYVAACDDAYYAGAGLRNDTLAGLSVDTLVAPGIRIKATGYHHNDKGAGLWYTPYVPSPDGTPVSLRTTEYAISRSGLIAGVEAEFGAHQVSAGFWHEGNGFDQARRFYATPVAAVPSPYEFPSNPFATQWQYHFDTKTTQFWLADTVTLSPALSAQFGFKSLDVTTDGQLQVGSGKPSGSISAKKNFLPQLGLNYKLNSSDELFSSFARNMRAFQGAATGTTPWATTDVGFAAIKDTLKPEVSDSVELGWRTAGKGYEGTVTAYAVNFHDRLLGVAAGSGIQGNPTILSNVGSVRTYGAEAALSLRLARSFNWYNSLSQSSSTYRNNVVSGGTTVATAGKHVVDAPDTMLKSIVGYDDGMFFGSVGADYMSQRYFSYLNDASVPSRTLLNASAGIRAKQLGMLRDASLTLSVNNLSDQKYVSTVGSNGFGNSGDNQTLLTGAPRQWFITFGAKL